ncbi:MAG: exopolysaccharide biosynthesis protein [Hyphomonadaceae bacterium]|nr:exopolysaccharide biosynthesis protein [Hyphomonadaceae bacterium]
MDTAATALVNPRKPRAETTSHLLEELRDAFPNERVSIGELLDKLEGRAIGLMMLILALPVCIPNVPGISTPFGFLMLAPAFQLVVGGKRLWVPKGMRAWTFPREGLRKAVNAAVPVLRRVEALIKPRFAPLTAFPFTIFLGVQTLLLAIVLILPIPGGNWPPAITISMTAIALLQRDGLLAVLSTLAAALSTVAAFYFFKFGVAALRDVSAWISAMMVH